MSRKNEFDILIAVLHISGLLIYLEFKNKKQFLKNYPKTSDSTIFKFISRRHFMHSCFVFLYIIFSLFFWYIKDTKKILILHILEKSWQHLLLDYLFLILTATTRRKLTRRPRRAATSPITRCITVIKSGLT